MWLPDLPRPTAQWGPADGANSAQSDPGELTAREIAAVNLIAEGLSNEELAVRLALSPSSVRLRLTSLYSKLGAKNRVEALMTAHRLGFVALD